MKTPDTGTVVLLSAVVLILTAMWWRAVSVCKRMAAREKAWRMWHDLRGLGYSLPRALPKISDTYGRDAAWSVLERVNKEDTP